MSALASSLSSVVSPADISVTSVTQPASFRRLLLWEAEPREGSWEPERRKAQQGSLFGTSRPVEESPCADADETAALFGVRKFQVHAAHSLHLQGHQVVPQLQSVLSLPAMLLLWEPCLMLSPGFMACQCPISERHLHGNAFTLHHCRDVQENPYSMLQVPMDVAARARRRPNTIEDAAPAALWQPLLPAVESLHRTVHRHLLQTESVSAADVAMQLDAGSDENVQTVQSALQAALSQTALKVSTRTCLLQPRTCAAAFQLLLRLPS